MKSSRLSHIFTRTIVQAFLLLIFIVFLFISSILIGNTVKNTNNTRLNAMDLSNELFISSKNMMSMARSYVITGKKIYKELYDEIDTIRDGRKPRYKNYYKMSVFLNKKADKLSSPADTKAIALMDLINKLDLTKEELKKLTDAKRDTLKLEDIERIAMSLANNKIGYKKAINLLHSKAYRQLEDSVITSDLEFNAMLNKRMNSVVARSEKITVYLQIIATICGLILLFLLWRIYKIVGKMLGGSITDVHTHMINIGKGDFSKPIVVPQKHAESVLGWLNHTRVNLVNLKKVNERLKNFYAALSQCNQAIVYAKNQTELFDIVCRDIVKFAGMQTAWVGMTDEENNTINPVSMYGSISEFIRTLVLSFGSKDSDSKSTTAQAILTQKPSWCQDYFAEPNNMKWYDEAEKYGIGSIAALPLKLEDKVVGVLVIYAKEKDIFDEQVKSLLEEMAMDISFALDRFKKDMEHAKAENEILESRNLLTSIINISPIRIFWKDRDLNYLGCNILVAKDAGVNEPGDLIGKNDTQFWWEDRAEKNHRDDREVLNSGIPKLFYNEHKTTQDGQDIWIRKSKVPLRNKRGDIIGILGMYEDVTTKKQEEERNLYLTNNDVLTNLPNRANFDVQTKFALKLAERNSENIVIMFLGLDHFRYINDVLGHDIGDLLLIETSKSFKSVLRKIDTIARFGGDEFAVLLPNIQINNLNFVAKKLLNIIKKPFIIHGNELNITVSIGIAIYPNDGVDSNILYKNAETALHHAKQVGHNNYYFFTPKMQENSARNLKLSNDLSHALENNELELFYQPQVNTKNEKLIGAEALLRWHHKEQGMISPAEFIPIAENNGLILPIGEWVLKTAITQAKRWMDEGFEPIMMAVNISAIQFHQQDLPQMITQMLQDIGLPPEYLELELTEGMAMSNPQLAINTMNDLYARDIRMSIDDFGTGYSSLSYLKKFKTYKLKIDQSFVRDIREDDDDKAIVKTIINMAKSLGLVTIAEGVESIEQLEYLEEQGCDEIQGYYYSRPIPAKEFERYRREHKSIVRV